MQQTGHAYIELDKIPKTGLKAYVAKLAQKHNISCSITNTDRLARAITRLSGDNVVPDETEKLIIELRKANVIDGKTMVTILGNYLDESRILSVTGRQH